MLLHESAGGEGLAGRRAVLLDDQDRSRWDREQIAEGAALVERALVSRRFGPYTLQAAIAAVHAEAPTAARTDWTQIVGLYDVLARVDPSPWWSSTVPPRWRCGTGGGGSRAGRRHSGSRRAGRLPSRPLARADLCRRLGRMAEARAAYERALALTRQEPERRFLERRLGELSLA